MGWAVAPPLVRIVAIIRSMVVRIAGFVVGAVLGGVVAALVLNVVLSDPSKTITTVVIAVPGLGGGTLGEALARKMETPGNSA